MNLRLWGVKKADAGRADYSDFATTAKIVKNASVMFVPPQDKHKLANFFYSVVMCGKVATTAHRYRSANIMNPSKHLFTLHIL